MKDYLIIQGVNKRGLLKRGRSWPTASDLNGQVRGNSRSLEMLGA